MQRRELPNLTKHWGWKLSDAIVATDKGPDNVDTPPLRVDMLRIFTFIYSLVFI